MNSSSDEEHETHFGREVTDKSVRPTSSRKSEHLNTRSSRIYSPSSFILTPPPTRAQAHTSEIRYPSTSFIEAAESANTIRSKVCTRCVADSTPNCVEGQQSTSRIIGDARSRPTNVPPFGGRSRIPTPNSYASDKKCSISYIGSNRVTLRENRRSTSHFGATVPKPTTLNSGNFERSKSNFGGTVTKDKPKPTWQVYEKSRSYWGGTASRTPTPTTNVHSYARPTACEKRRCTTYCGGTVPKAPQTTITPANLDKNRETKRTETKRTTCYTVRTRRLPTTANTLDCTCVENCSLPHIGDPPATNPDAIEDFCPCVGSYQEPTPPHSNNNDVPANDELFPENDEEEEVINLRQTHSCRICHDDKQNEPLMSPCHCKGTIANIHHSCLARWLGLDMTRSFKCELCNYRYPVVEARRYTMLESIPVWVRDPDNKERFCSFMCVSGFITMINLVVYVTAILVMRYTALSAAPDWFVMCMFLFLVLLYIWNLVQCFKETIFDHWYWWWHNCINVRLDVQQMMDTTKVKANTEERLEESGSCDSLQSCHEMCAIDLTTRPERY